MSELCNSSNANSQFSAMLISEFFLFCSFILSHPLYFSYFIFFSPYLFKLLSFLSPLFITTSILLIALLSLSESKLGSLHSALQKLQSKIDDDQSQEFQDNHFEDLQAYIIVFDTSMFDVPEANMSQAFNSPIFEASDHGGSNSRENPAVISQPEVIAEKDLSETESCRVEDKEIDPVGAKFKKAEHENSSMGFESNAVSSKSMEAIEKGNVEKSRLIENSQNLGVAEASPQIAEVAAALGCFGSMRREKEWRRTLACKLYEERHNVEGSEGMDSLWETLEVDSAAKGRTETEKKKKKKHSYAAADDGDDDDEDGGGGGGLCCLQALKFSTGKMNLGMGRPNIVKISKALKGFGWLHHHVSRHSKRSYN